MAKEKKQDESENDKENEPMDTSNAVPEGGLELPKNYDALNEEPRIQKFWEQNGIYKFDPVSKKKIYSIDTPPPTVSGKMHIGHSFSYSQQDFVARYKR